jgi:hypothetical protein
MSRPYFLRFWSALGLLGMAGCVEPYMPSVIDAPTTYLVVDGFINGKGRTRIRLSRTINVATTTAPPPEKGAKLFIVDNMGTRYALAEQSSGYYLSDSLLLTPTRQYQLSLTTAASAEYASDLTPLKVTPPLQFGWVRQNGEMDFRLSTADPTGLSRFYRWSTTETWEFNSAYKSVLQYRGGLILPRITPIYTCWHTDRHTAINQRSTTQLSQDAVTNLQMLHYSDHDERFKIRYSVLVTQYAETAEEFAYLEILRKNTEAVGGLNDPLPAPLTGNMHRVGTPDEPVLGFVGAHTVEQKRLFIVPAEMNLPTGWTFTTPYAACKNIIEPVPDSLDMWPNIIYIPQTRNFTELSYVAVDYTLDRDGNPNGYLGSTRDCVDCRTRGSNVKPTFW